MEVEQLPEKSDKRADMARYVVHAIRASQYAIMALSGQITDEAAREEYEKAMDNYDQIMDSPNASYDASMVEMAKGADAVTALIEANRDKV